MKIILIVIDGLGDKPVPQLGNKTPLEAARTPNLDWLVKLGMCGQVLPYYEKGKLPTSEDTHLALLGYNPKIFSPGRGVLETLGIGMKILAGDVCLRGNFATVNPKNLRIIDRRAGRIKDTEKLIQAISGIKIGGVKFLIGKAVSHRIGIVMRGEKLSPGISAGDPKREGVKPLKILAKEKSRKAIFTAKILNQFLEKSYSILKNHPLNQKRKLPANYILVRGAGRFKKINPVRKNRELRLSNGVKSFKEKYGLKAGFVAGGTLYKGIGKFLGMKEIKVKGANALPTTNLKGKFLAAKTGLGKYDFVFCHIKAADNLAEDGNFKGKKEFIEKIDGSLKPLTGLKNALLVITADHSTCSLSKKHCSAPIPILIFGKKTRPNKFKKFSERNCQKGNLGEIRQVELMSKVITLYPVRSPWQKKF